MVRSMACAISAARAGESGVRSASSRGPCTPIAIRSAPPSATPRRSRSRLPSPLRFDPPGSRMTAAGSTVCGSPSPSVNVAPATEAGSRTATAIASPVATVRGKAARDIASVTRSITSGSTSANTTRLLICPFRPAASSTTVPGRRASATANGPPSANDRATTERSGTGSRSSQEWNAAAEPGSRRTGSSPAAPSTAPVTRAGSSPASAKRLFH